MAADNPDGPAPTMITSRIGMALILVGRSSSSGGRRGDARGHAAATRHRTTRPKAPGTADRRLPNCHWSGSNADSFGRQLTVRGVLMPVRVASGPFPELLFRP